MKAWSVIDETTGFGAIVYARTQGRAKAIGLRLSLSLEGGDWISLRIRRLSLLDVRRDDEGIEEDLRVYYEQGWFPEESARACDFCGRYEYDEFPESRIVCEDGDRVCAACVERKETE